MGKKEVIVLTTILLSLVFGCTIQIDSKSLFCGQAEKADANSPIMIEAQGGEWTNTTCEESEKVLSEECGLTFICGRFLNTEQCACFRDSSGEDHLRVKG